jgi:RNA 3'-terminal phosphate cyclase-like protein
MGNGPVDPLREATLRVSGIRASESPSGLNEADANLLKLFQVMCAGPRVEIKDEGRTLTYRPGTIMGGTFSFETNAARGLLPSLEVVACLAPFARDPVAATLFGVTDGHPVDPDVDPFRVVVVPWRVEASVSVPRRGPRGRRRCTPEGVARPRAPRVVPRGPGPRPRRVRGVAWSTRVGPRLPQRAATLCVWCAWSGRSSR